MYAERRSSIQSATAEEGHGCYYCGSLWFQLFKGLGRLSAGRRQQQTAELGEFTWETHNGRIITLDRSVKFRPPCKGADAYQGYEAGCPNGFGVPPRQGTEVDRPNPLGESVHSARSRGFSRRVACLPFRWTGLVAGFSQGRPKIVEDLDSV